MKIADQTHSAVEMVKTALAKAKTYEDYHIFTYLNTENALKKAADIDARIQRGEKVGRLAGVPYALKDNFLSPEGPTTASSKILEPFVSPVTSTAVAKLEAEGAIMLGRTNLDSFAHGSSTENSYFGPTLNSRDKTRVAGGSSGGSAVAVALDIVQFATGTDTGGSIRQPASFNGVYGFKPTYGTISRYGVVAMASSTDVIGFFTQSSADLDLLMSITSGQDPKDLTTLPDFYAATPLHDLATPRKIGIISDFDNDSVDSHIRAALAHKIQLLESQGHEIVRLKMPALKYALAVYYIVVPAEVSSNLSRHDGIRYGFSAPGDHTLSETYGLSRSQGFMPENKRRIMTGNFVLSSGFYDAYYLKAQKARTKIIEEYEAAFKKCDFILTPVSPNPAFRLGEKVGDPVAMYLEDVMSVPINLAGLPSLAIPAGTIETGDAKGCSLGLQLIGPRRSDRDLLRFSETLAEPSDLQLASDTSPAPSANSTPNSSSSSEPRV